MKNCALIPLYLFSCEEHSKSNVCECPSLILDYQINNCALIPTYFYVQNTSQVPSAQVSRQIKKDTRH